MTYINSIKKNLPRRSSQTTKTTKTTKTTRIPKIPIPMHVYHKVTELCRKDQSGPDVDKSSFHAAAVFNGKHIMGSGCNNNRTRYCSGCVGTMPSMHAEANALISSHGSSTVSYALRSWILRSKGEPPWKEKQMQVFYSV